MSNQQSSSAMDKNPVIRTTRWAASLLKNKLITALLLLVQGILFIVAPAGNMTLTVQIAAVVVILACVINIFLHLRPGDRSGLAWFLSGLNAVIIAAAVFCLVSPATVEPYVRVVVGVVMILTNLVNLIETLKMERKKGAAFVIGVIASVVMMGLGFAMTFADEMKIVSMQQGIGIFLILNSLIDIWYLIRLRIAGK